MTKTQTVQHLLNQFDLELNLTSEVLNLEIEGDFVRNKCLRVKYLKLNLDCVEWDLGKIIFENVLNKPVKGHIHDFIIYDLVSSGLHEVFSNIFDYYYGEA